MYIKFRENKPRKDHRGSDLTKELFVRELVSNESVIFDGGYRVLIFENEAQIETFELHNIEDLFTAIRDFVTRAKADGFTQVDGQAMRSIYLRSKMMPEIEEMEVTGSDR